tara:strand:- start:734 stop:1027 length:294 start_codon:yes stop_codon:yes gene_type:complete
MGNMESRLRHKCTDCRSRAVVEGYKLTRGGKSVMWCQECLHNYSQGKLRYAGEYASKLRDTNIEEYDKVINSDLFIEFLNKENKKSATSWRFHTKYK